ncbi:hypothetical protein EVAR_43269_1 [Eumeta japonica]|uniref:Integrase catalytic domain-containing protein n=1 Tax=Eumeta variegata TaxID=151549 RepID=A0A4C1WW03_EUMVA|nr:hypothetical protein EVAR_43269_1 [Eumeta japonica]
MPISKGYRYCLIAVDRYTRWPEAIPITDINAETVATALLTCWISRFGCPTDIVTDSGKQFESTLFQHLARVDGFHHRRTTTYHPTLKTPQQPPPAPRPSARCVTPEVALELRTQGDGLVYVSLSRPQVRRAVQRRIF